MQVLQEVYQLEGDRLWTVAAGFGGGVGRYQSVCGALAGGAMALGLVAGRSVEDPKAEPKKVGDMVRPKVRALIEGFTEKFGHFECRALLPFDFNAPGGHDAYKNSPIKYETCRQFSKYVVEKLAEEFNTP